MGEVFSRVANVDAVLTIYIYICLVKLGRKTLYQFVLTNSNDVGHCSLELFNKGCLEWVLTWACLLMVLFWDSFKEMHIMFANVWSSDLLSGE